MLIIEIIPKKEERILQNYLVSNCDAWIKNSKLYVPLKKVLDYFGSKESFRSFVTHTSSTLLPMKQKNIDLKKLSAIQSAEIIFGDDTK